MTITKLNHVYPSAIASSFRATTLHAFTFFAIFLAIVQGANAQVLYGSIVGNVTDASSAPIPGAQIQITNIETGLERVANSNNLGAYNFSNVPSGSYRISIQSEGFSTFVRNQIAVTINEVVRLDGTLQVGQVTEQIIVESSAAILQADRAEVRGEVSATTLSNIPNPPGRNYQMMLSTIPGFGPAQQTNSVAANPARSVNFNVNGTSRNGLNVRIDGANMSAVGLPQLSAYIPAIEAIENVNVVTNSFDAEQGLAGGAAVNVQIKSGTNEIHGSAFEYNNNDSMKARPYFLPPGEDMPKTLMNQFGGTIGGPIKKDRLFFFASVEVTRNRQSGNSFATVPTAAIRSGDMSESSRPIYDPMTGNANGTARTPFLNNVVPQGRIEPISQKLASLTPLPNGDGIANNLFNSAVFSYNREVYDGKVNWNPNDKLSMYARFGLLRYNWTSPAALGDLGGPQVVSSAGFAGSGFGTTKSTSVAATYVVSPTFVVDGNVGFSLMDTNSKTVRMDENLGLDFLGIPGTNGTRDFQGGWPQFAISSYTQMGIGFNNWPIIWNEPSKQYTANATWLKGTHNVRFGTDISHLALNRVQHELSGAFGGAPGAFQFTGGLTTLNGGPSPNQFNSYADFLLGMPARSGKMLQQEDRLRTRASAYSLYVRDQWQVTRNLTFTYGGRWEVFPLPTRSDRQIETFDAANNQMRICGFGDVPSNCNIEVPKNGFAPRVGLALRVTDSFVIRAGYGITNDPYQLTRTVIANYPQIAAVDVRGPNSFQSGRSLRDGIPEIVIPSLGNGILDVPNPYVVLSLPDRIPRGYVQSWNFTAQKRLGLGWVGQVGYVATRQVRRLGTRDINAAAPGTGNAGRPYNKAYGKTTTINHLTAVGSGTYDALQATLERRFSSGFQMNAAYTYSKAMGLCCNFDSDGSPAIDITGYYHLNRSVANFDRTQNFQLTNIYELPFGKGKRWANGGGIASAIAGGWRLNGIFSAMTGLPFSVSAAATSLNAPGNSQRGDQVKASVTKIGAIGSNAAFYDPLAFAPVTEARFGTAGFNSLRGPGYINLDMGMFRQFSFNDRIKLQFRAEAFNVSNTPHFGNPGGNVSNLQLNPDGSVRSLGGFMAVTGIGPTAASRDNIDERMFRLGLRLSF